MKTMIRSRKTTIRPIKFLVIFNSVSPIVMLDEEHCASMTYFQLAGVAYGSSHEYAGKFYFLNLNWQFFLPLHWFSNSIVNVS